MLPTLATIVLVNTYSWMGGQGYCAYDFALTEYEAEYANVEIMLRPQFEPGTLATGLDKLDDVSISLESIGGSQANATATAQVETDCAITGLDIVSATALKDGAKVDLLALKAVSIDTYDPLPVTLQGKTDNQP